MPESVRPGRRQLMLVLLPLLAAGPAGCSGPKFYPVRGRVILRETNRPLTEGEVRFEPVSRPDLVASGRIGPDGTYALSTPPHGEGALEGACRVAVIVPPRDGRRVILERFEGYATSDLRVTVTERAENYFTLEVHGKAP